MRSARSSVRDWWQSSPRLLVEPLLDLGWDIIPITLELERAIGIRVERPQGQFPRRLALPQLQVHAVAVNVAAHDGLVSLVVLQSPLRRRAGFE